MAKAKVAYVCTDCGSEYTKWAGQCLSCKAWNTISEFRQGKASSAGAVRREGLGAIPAQEKGRCFCRRFAC